MFKRLALVTTALIAMTGPILAGEFDAQIKACHDAAWELDAFKSLPNAAVSGYMGGFDDAAVYAYWIVDWDDVQAAGKCTFKRGSNDIVTITMFKAPGQ